MVAQASSSATVRNKVVIRRLPPTLPEEIFWKSVSQWIDDKTCHWKRYIKGKAGDGTYDVHPVHSRAYVLMASPEALVDFVRGFDGHVFKAKTGAEYRAVVEFAPVQITPYKAKVKTDARQGTIDEDPDYLSYLESLKAEPVKPALEVSVPPPQPTTTPLLEHLRTQGKSKKSKSSSKSAASSSSANESARRAAALASVTAAATKRAGQAGSGPVMVAGKGREVHIATIAPETNTNTPNGQGDGENKKKGRNRKKGKKDGESGENTSTSNGKQNPQPPQSNQPTSKAQAGSKPVPPQGIKQEGGRSTPSAGKNPDGASTPKADRPNKGGRGGGGGGKGGEAAGKQTEGAGRGGAASGGGGRGRGKDRSGKAQVMEILTRNSAGGAPARGGRGGNVGAGAGSGRVGAPVQSEAGASRARIDVP